MTGRATEALVVFALALLVTVVVAAPVLRAPEQRIFGMEIVGRHYDPFTVMEQFAQPLRLTAFLQPMTDVPGALLARYIGAVAAYNLLVLISFPLTAVAAFLLARHCALSTIAAGGAAFAVAFSPFHLAQAAYHPHVAQLQWLPLYLLLLWRCLDWPTWPSAVLLAIAIVAVSLSNFYGGLIAAVITPIAIAAYWWLKMRRDTAPLRRLLTTAAVLGAVGVLGAGYAFYVAADVLRDGTVLGFARGDLARYGAHWWSYVAPPVANPWFGSVARGLRGSDPGLLEQQLSLGWGLLALSAVAVVAWIRHRHTIAVLSAVPILAAVAAFAMLCSVAPMTLIYGVLPMFRAYARFGGVVQLMIALLAAIGAEQLWQSGASRARAVAVALVICAAIEYAVWPPALWRDVLPTAAHRWTAEQPETMHVLDCYPLTQESESVQWLTGGRVTLRERSISDCREPGLIANLSATGMTHLLVRRGSPEYQWLQGRSLPVGLQLTARFADSAVFAVTDPPSLIRTVDAHSFYPVEFNDAWTWRWMGPQASWTVVNSSARALIASVELETNAFHEPRRITIALDGADVQDVLIDPQRARRTIGPLMLRPGDHTLTFRAAAAPTAADDLLHNGDPRPLSVAFGDWHWSVDDGQR